jgi:hypothetical protein
VALAAGGAVGLGEGEALAAGVGLVAGLGVAAGDALAAGEGEAAGEALAAGAWDGDGTGEGLAVAAGAGLALGLGDCAKAPESLSEMAAAGISAAKTRRKRKGRFILIVSKAGPKQSPRPKSKAKVQSHPRRVPVRAKRRRSNTRPPNSSHDSCVIGRCAKLLAKRPMIAI